ncbi:MAG: O-antigen ligase family protein [Desulfobacterales bacterium]|nr:O-antigen ligase family protein [Desulfobacterales bacterium]
MTEEKRRLWAQRLDRFCVVAGALVPVGLVIGNVGFEALVAAVALAWIVRSCVARDNPVARVMAHPLALPWMAWYAVMVISVAVNGPGSKGWAHDVVFIRYPLFGLALIDVSGRRPLARSLIWGLAAGVVWAAVNTLAAYGLGHDLIGRPLIRYTGKLKEAARIAGMAGFAAPFFLAWGILDEGLSKKEKAVILALGALAFVQVVQTHVRTALLAATVAVFFSTAILVVRRRAFAVAAGLCAVLALALALWFSFSSRRQLSFYSIYDRIYYWKVALAMWMEHPVLGVGISSFQDAYKEMAASGMIDAFVSPDGLIWEQKEVMHAHSLFFMVLACTGLAGLAAFGWLFVNAVRVIARHLDGWGLGLVSWPVALVVFGLTGFNIYHSWYQALQAFFLALIGVQVFEEKRAREADSS